MKTLKLLAIALCVYMAIVVAVETLVVFMGKSHADRGVQAGETWVVMTTTDADGSTQQSVLAGVENEGRLYIAANHWPRGWYNRALDNPDVQVAIQGEEKAYRAVPVSGDERTRIAQVYSLPVVVRALTGFPPRSFLRLDPR